MGKIWLSLLTLPLLGQNLQVRSLSLAPGGKGILAISIESPAGKEPAALQWEMVLPDAAIWTAVDIQPGSAAQAASKSVACARIWAAHPGEAHSAVYRCIMAGGRDNIANGTLAVLNLAARPKIAPGRYAVRLERAMAVSRDARKTPLKDAAGRLVITRPGARPSATERGSY